MSGKRIRTVKPEWLEDERLAGCTDTTRMVSVALILLADDYGNGRAHPLYLASRIWPYGSRDPRETLASLDDSLRELVAIGFVELYSAKNQAYYSVRNWSKHQRIDRPSRPLVPSPSQADGTKVASLARHSREARECLDTPSRDTPAGSGSGSGGGGARARAIPVPVGSAPGQCPGPGSSATTTTTAVASLNGNARVSGRDAAACWAKALAAPGGNPSAMHAFESWRGEFETVAAACNAVKGKPHLALQVVTQWFWLCPDGPVQSGRLSRGKASPGYLAKHITQDLEAALQWWQKRKASQPEPHEATG